MAPGCQAGSADLARGNTCVGSRVLPRSPLLSAEELGPLEQAVSEHLGRAWTGTHWADLADRSSHQAAVLHGSGLAVFAKLLVAPDAVRHARSELAGLWLLQARSQVRVPLPIGDGWLDLGGEVLLLSEAVPERVPAQRTPTDWAAIGTALAQLHAVHGETFGLDAGRLDAAQARQAASRPVPSSSTRRPTTATPRWTSLWWTTSHLSRTDSSRPTPSRALSTPTSARRRELWRIFAYLGVLVVDGHQPWGRSFARRLAEAIRQYA